MIFLRKLFFSVSFLCLFYGFACPMSFGERKHASTVVAIKKLVHSFKLGKTFTLREVVQQLPFIKDIGLPPGVGKLLDGIIFSSPKLKKTKDSIEMTFKNPPLLGQKKAMTSRIYVGPDAKGEGFGFTLGVGFPGVFSYKDLFPDMGRAASKLTTTVLPKKIAKHLKDIGQTVSKVIKFADWIKFKDAGIVLSILPFFKDPVWGGLMKGVNAISQVKLGGPLEKLTNFFGKELTTVQFRGLIVPSLIGSSVSATHIGTVPLLKFPGFELRTSSSTVSIGLEELASSVIFPWVWGSTGLQIKFPGQKDFVNFEGFITIHAESLDIGGQSVGMVENIFAIPGLDLGNLGVFVTVNYFVAWATAVASIIHGGAITGEIQIGGKKLKLLAKIVLVDPPALPSLVFEGSAEGGLSRSDIVDFALKLASAASKIKGIKIDPSKLKRVFERVLPPFTIGDHKVLLALRTSIVFGKLYSKGLHVKGSMNLAGFGGGVDLSVSTGGLKGKLYFDEIRIPKKNPIIIISGAGQDGVRGTKDDGPIGFLELSWKNQEMFVDALLSIPPLGINSETKIDITPQGGIRFDVKHKLGGLIDSKLHIEGKPGSLDSFKVSGFLYLKLLNKIRSFLVDKMGRLAKEANADLKEANEIAQQEIDVWLDNQVESFDQQIADLDKKIVVAKKKCEDLKEKDAKLICKQRIQVDFLKNKRKNVKLRRKIKWKKSLAKVAKGAAKIVSRTTRGALKVAKGLLKFTGKVIGGGFNISEIRFEGTLTDLIKKAKGMKAFVRGRIADRPFEQEFQLDLKRLDQLPRQILNVLKQIVRRRKYVPSPHRS